MPLTDTRIRTIKPGPTVQKLSDGQGLQLWITPTGGRSWKLAYRYGTKQKKLEIGPYPALGLADARAARDAAKKLLAAGIDPVAHARAEEAAQDAAEAVQVTTFRVIAAELLAKKVAENKAANTVSKLTWLMDVANEDLGDRPISGVKAAEVLAMLRKLEAKGHLETARRMRSLTSEIFRFAIASGRAESDPAAFLLGALTAPTVTHRAAIIDPVQFGGLLRSIDAFKGQATTKAGLQLLALLFVRPGELRAAEWAEFDLDRALWSIPAAKTKLRREHLVPLAPQAIAIIERLKPVTGRGPLLLPGVGMSGGEGRRIAPKAMSENTLMAAILRMGYDRSEHSAHGFRASASTLLYESGKWSGEAIEAQLAHADSNSVRAAYKRSQHLPERTEMMSWWASHLDELRLLKPPRG